MCMLINRNRYLLIECHTPFHAANVYAQNNYSEAIVCCQCYHSLVQTFMIELNAKQVIIWLVGCLIESGNKN